MCDEFREAVRQLHQPVWYRTYHLRPEQVWLVCSGCDEGPHAEGPADWPCRTADLAYSPEEIAAREPQVPECPEDHGTRGDGQPVRLPAVFIRRADGSLVAARFKCDHVIPVPAVAADLGTGWD